MAGDVGKLAILISANSRGIDAAFDHTEGRLDKLERRAGQFEVSARGRDVGIDKWLTRAAGADKSAAAPQSGGTAKWLVVMGREAGKVSGDLEKLFKTLEKLGAPTGDAGGLFGGLRRVLGPLGRMLGEVGGAAGGAGLGKWAAAAGRIAGPLAGAAAAAASMGATFAKIAADSDKIVQAAHGGTAAYKTWREGLRGIDEDLAAARKKAFPSEMAPFKAATPTFDKATAEGWRLIAEVEKKVKAGEAPRSALAKARTELAHRQQDALQYDRKIAADEAEQRKRDEAKQKGADYVEGIQGLHQRLQEARNRLGQQQMEARRLGVTIPGEDIDKGMPWEKPAEYEYRSEARRAADKIGTRQARELADEIDRTNDLEERRRKGLDEEQRKRDKLAAMQSAFNEQLSDVQTRLEASRAGIDPRILEAQKKGLDPAKIAEMDKALKAETAADLEKAGRTPLEQFEARLKDLKGLELSDKGRRAAIGKAYDETVGQAAAARKTGPQYAAGASVGSAEAYKLIASAMAGVTKPDESTNLLRQANELFQRHFPDQEQKLGDVLEVLRQIRDGDVAGAR